MEARRPGRRRRGGPQPSSTNPRIRFRPCPSLPTLPAHQVSLAHCSKASPSQGWAERSLSSLAISTRSRTSSSRRAVRSRPGVVSNRTPVSVVPGAASFTPPARPPRHSHRLPHPALGRIATRFPPDARPAGRRALAQSCRSQRVRVTRPPAALRSRSRCRSQRVRGNLCQLYDAGPQSEGLYLSSAPVDPERVVAG